MFNLSNSEVHDTTVPHEFCSFVQCHSCEEKVNKKPLKTEEVDNCRQCGGSVLKIERYTETFKDKFTILEIQGRCPNCNQRVKGVLSDKSLARKLLGNFL